MERDLWDLANREAWAHVLEEWRLLFHPIPLSLAALAKLDTQRVALVANQPAKALEVLEEQGYLDCVRVVILDTLCGTSKPDAAIYELALARLGVRPERAVMIGDRIDNDIEPAKRLGMAAVWTKPLPYDPGLPVPQVPNSWKQRYEIGRPHRIRQELMAYEALPKEHKPDFRVTSLNVLSDGVA